MTPHTERLQHELDLRTRECQEWKTRAEKAEAERADLASRVMALNLEKMELHARLNAAMKVVEVANKWMRDYHKRMTRKGASDFEMEIGRALYVYYSENIDSSAKRQKNATPEKSGKNRSVADESMSDFDAATKAG